MLHQIVIPESTSLTLKLPKEYVGQEVEVIAFAIGKEKKSRTTYSWKNALDFFNKHTVSFKNYKFDREEANTR